MRPICPRCQRPLRACLCAWVRATDNQVPVLVLQHPLEAGHAKGSVPLLALGLRDCTVRVGAQFDAVALAGWLGAPGAALLLYPDHAGPAGPAPAGRPSGPDGLQPGHALKGAGLPGCLVLLDGTWRQARALLRAHPLLQALPRRGLPEVAPARYAIRRAHQPAQRSTLEAACLALGLLEDRPAHYAPMLDAFSGWVAAMAAQAGARQCLSAASPPGP